MVWQLRVHLREHYGRRTISVPEASASFGIVCCLFLSNPADRYLGDLEVVFLCPERIVVQRMKLTKGRITREQALAISKEYVEFVEDHKHIDTIIDVFSSLKRGQKCITYVRDQGFFEVRVTSLKFTFRCEDGYPETRVSNGEYSWRCDGDGYAYPC